MTYACKSLITSIGSALHANANLYIWSAPLIFWHASKYSAHDLYNAAHFVPIPWLCTI